MILSILADHPYSPVTKTHGEESNLDPTITFSTFSPKTSLINLVSGSKEDFYSSNFFFSSSDYSSSNPSLEQFFNFFPSNSFNYYITYSSIGSIIQITSYPFFFKDSTKGETLTEALFSPVIQKTSFYPSFILPTQSFKEVYSSPLLLEQYLRYSANLSLLVASSWIPSLRFLENYSLNFLKSSAFSEILQNISITFLTMFFLITLRILLC